MGKIIGIDLGTVNSAVSIIENGEPKIIPNSEGKRTTPSIVAFLDKGETKIGEPAKRQSVINSKNTINSVKRLMGVDYSDIEKYLDNFSYNIVNKNNLPYIKINNKEYTPQEISAMILQKMKKTAEDYIGEKVKDAVITVPAWFNDRQRTATKEAGEIAGLNVLRIINEPTSAALAYGSDKNKEDKIISIIDVGGGTTDISILDIGDGVVEVKSTSGDNYLGGDDFDKVIIDWLAESFEKEYNIDLRKDDMALQRLKEAAEKAKIELSSTASSEINLPYIMPVDGVPKHLVKTLTRATFDKLSDDLLKRLETPMNKAIKESGVKSEDIKEVLLVGGSTRIIAIQELVKKVFNKEPNKSLNPDEVVSLGAAIQGGVLTGDVDDILLLDVTPLSLGLETMGGVMTKLIEANTTIPTSKKQIFTTASDNQDSVTIHVLQGEREFAKDNKILGKFNLTNIPPAKRGVPQIEVTFDINANGILNVSAKDLGTGKEQKITIQNSSNLSDSEIEKMKKEAEENFEKDKKEKEKVDILNNADSLIFQTEKQIKEFDDKLNSDDKEKLQKSVDKLKEYHKNKDIDNIKTETDNLTKVWNEISTKLYQQNQNQTQEQNTNNKPEDDVEDIDYEEVN